MDCKEIRQYCHAYLDCRSAGSGQSGAWHTDDSEFSAMFGKIQTHLVVCPNCARYFDNEVVVITSLNVMMRRKVETAPKNLQNFLATLPAKSKINQTNREKTEIPFLNPKTAPKSKTAEINSTAFYATKIAPIPTSTKIMRFTTGLAAMLMFSASAGLYGLASCVKGQCHWAKSFGREYVAVNTGAVKAGLVSGDEHQIETYLKQSGLFAGALPKLGKCMLKPDGCGKIATAGMPDAVFIKYHCECENTGVPENVTLLIMESGHELDWWDALERDGKSFRGARDGNRNIISWQKNDKLHVLITEKSLDEAVGVAAIAAGQ